MREAEGAEAPERAPAGAPAEETSARVPDERTGATDVASHGPPADAVTSYEDLPADLFGETGGEPEPPPGPAAEDAGARKEVSAPGSAPVATPVTAPEGAEAAQEDTLAKIGRAFPGRIVAIDPAGHTREEEESPSMSDASAEDASGDPPDPAT